MGALDPVRRLFSGKQKTPRVLELLPGEREVARAVAAYRPGSMKSVGGNLVLTNLRLVFTPLEFKDLSEVLGWTLGRPGVPDGVSGQRVKIGKFTSAQPAVDLAGVVAGTDGSLRKAPTLVITGADGIAQEFGLFERRTSPNGSSRNVPVRDEFLQRIQRASR